MSTLVFVSEASRGDELKPGFVAARADWLRAHDLAPEDIYRVEVHIIDVPLIRVFEFARNAEGHAFCGLDHVHNPFRPSACGLARRDPYDVLLRFDPPPEVGLVETSTAPTTEGETS